MTFTLLHEQYRFKNDVWSEERTECAPTRDRHYTISSQVTVCARSPGQCHHLLKACRRASGPPTDCTDTPVESERIIETELVLLVRGPYQLPL